MIEELDKTVNTLVYSNDASASVFGWNFQVNAAIFLALHYIENLSDIKVESDEQDIELTLNDSSKVFAQAKSAQDYSTAINNKKKIKDGLLSLARTHQTDNNGLFIYISNIPNVFSEEYGLFNNNVRSYKDLPLTIKNQVDDLFVSIKADLDKKIKENKRKPNVIEKLNYYCRCIENFNKEKLCFSVVVPYIGHDESRYSPIVDKITGTLSEYFQLSHNQIIALRKKLLRFYHECFELNASTSDDEDISKAIKRKDFIWPAIALTIDQAELNPDEWCAEVVDESTCSEIFEGIGKLMIPYHERFEFITKIMTDYTEYKRNHIGSLTIEKNFANEQYLSYLNEFDGYDIEENIKKLITIWFLYRTVKNNILINKITKRS